MEPKTILLGNSRDLTVKVSRNISMILGAFYFLTGTFALYKGSTELWPFFQTFTGIVFIILTFLWYANTPYAPKVIIGATHLSFKTKLLKKAVSIPWSAIEGLEYRSYEIRVNSRLGAQAFVLDTSAEISREVKSNIRAIAEVKGIEVTGG